MRSFRGPRYRCKECAAPPAGLGLDLCELCFAAVECYGKQTRNAAEFRRLQQEAARQKMPLPCARLAMPVAPAFVKGYDLCARAHVRACVCARMCPSVHPSVRVSARVSACVCVVVVALCAC